MRMMRTAIVCLLASAIIIPAAVGAPVQISRTYYFPDKPFPQFMNMWQEGWSLASPDGDTALYARPDMQLGGYVFVYIANRGGKPLKVTDLIVQGVPLSQGLGRTHKPKQPDERFGASVLLSKLPAEKLEALKAAGWPVYWKPEPGVVEPGAMGEIVLRLRRAPKVDEIKLGIIHDTGALEAVVPIKQAQPRFQTISFTPDLKSVHLYPTHPQGKGTRPTKLFMDGQDITSMSRVESDKAIDVCPIVVRLAQPLKWMSYHLFTAAYADGSAATAGIRAWGRDIVYGMWGASLERGPTERVGKDFLTDWARHNINCSMGMVSGDGSDFYRSEDGWALCDSLGIGRMTNWTVEGHTPTFFFLMDEPDAHDYGTQELPATDRLGSLGQYLVEWADVLRRHGPETPILLNIDNTYKPENWYTYHQISDIPCLDPYYPEQIDQCYRKYPSRFGAHTKPTYVLGATTISQSAAAPKPLHVILCSTKYNAEDKSYQGRYPTPEEKRLEVYYAISAGAKGLSYWWFSPDGVCQGVGSNEDAAKALWKEIGLLGAEVRTAGPVITTSCPISLSVKAPRLLMVRTLLSGTDTVAVIAMNDNVLSDRLGTVVVPVQKANVSVQVPSWMKPADAFEVTYGGVKEVPWKRDGASVTLDLGTVSLSRFVIVTSDAALRGRLEGYFQSTILPNVRAITADP